MADSTDNNSQRIHENEQQDEQHGHVRCTALQEELQELQERQKYLHAEFDNYKKRVERDRAQWIAHAQAEVFVDVLAIVDHLERGLHQIKSEELTAQEQAHLQGFELIVKELYKLLQKYHIEEITQVTVFDPEHHEAVMQEQSTEHDSGHIVRVLQKGYTHKGHILRPAKVSVAQ